MQAFFESIWYILFYLCLFFSCYYILLAIVGILYHKQKYRIRNDEQSFCIFVPCHNEAAVIGATVDNLGKINYNESLFEIYFIADNCTDSTAASIKEAIVRSGKRNFYVLERNENEATKRGKPHAIRWGIELLSRDASFYDKYDMFMILDADNFVDADILKQINSQYLSYPENNRPVMIQSYLDSKNKNSFIARAYFIAYRLTNGFFQLSRHTLGLVPAIGGTGFAVTNEFLKSIGGYTCSSLTRSGRSSTGALVIRSTRDP